MASRLIPILASLICFVSAAVGESGDPSDQRNYGGYDYGFDVGRFLKHEWDERFVLGPLPMVNGTPPLRVEVRELEKDKDKWTLYLLALSQMQYMDQSDPLSWFQFSGIHGMPFQPWGGVEPVAGSEDYGYCHHVSILFPTWHRPYVAMFEHILYHLVQNIASLFQNPEARKRYQEAAVDFRIPYWDWAASPPDGGGVFPDSFSANPFVDVEGPNGAQRISNPLFSYHFRPRDIAAFENKPWNTWTSTIRAPTSRTASALSNDARVAHDIDQGLSDLQQRLYALFSNYHNFTTFGNEAWASEMSNSSYDSLESIHDVIHGRVGGYQGHMAFVPYSGFDPVFFLHHGMVDRLLAMWQALNPDSWVLPERAVEETYTVSVGQILDSKTPLTPFFADTDGNFWDSDMVRDPTVFGYTYADVAGIPLDGSPVDRESQARVREIINDLYSASSPMKLVEEFTAGGDTWNEGSADKTAAASKPGKSVIVDDKYHEWIANVQVNKQALGGPFFIHFFLGCAPDDSHNWLDAPNRLGATNVFASPGQRNSTRRGHTMTGTVHLTAGLVREVLGGALSGLEPSVVEPYLKENLRCAAVTSDGRVVEGTEINSLHVQIISSSVQVPSCDEELPSWEAPSTHFDFI